MLDEDRATLLNQIVVKMGQSLADATLTSEERHAEAMDIFAHRCARFALTVAEEDWVQSQVFGIESILETPAPPVSSAPAVTPPSGTTANNSQFRDHAMLAGRDIVIKQFFAGKPPVDGAALLHEYLTTTVLEQYELVRLQRLTTKAHRGDESTTTPQLQLLDIYANLKLDKATVRSRDHAWTKAHTQKIINRLRNRDGDDVLPERRVTLTINLTTQQTEDWRVRHPDAAKPEPQEWDDLANEDMITVTLERPLLASEALAPRHQ